MRSPTKNKFAVTHGAKVYLSEKNIVRPDLAVVRNISTVDEDGNIHGVPDLVVEVLSYSTMKNDLGVKMMICEQSGMFTSLNEYERAEIKDKIQVGIFPELEIDVERIFYSVPD